MSYEYDQYLTEHKANVEKGFTWLRHNFPYLVERDDCSEWLTAYAHDSSKTNPDEYKAYDDYFYGGNRSFSVVAEFRKAWLQHIHSNKHHWQHWVLLSDDPKEGEIVLEMPYPYIIEMICDWWSFSWKQEKLDEIFSWYEERKEYIKLHPNTRKTLENILGEMKTLLETI